MQGGEKLVLERVCALAVTIENVPEASPDAIERTWPREAMMVTVCAPSHPLASLPKPIPKDEFGQHIQIVVTDNQPAAEKTRQGVTGKRQWLVNDPGAKCDLLKAGLSWGHLPRHLAAEDLASGQLVELKRRAWHLGPLTFVVSQRRGYDLSACGSRLVELLGKSERMPKAVGRRSTRNPRGKARRQVAAKEQERSGTGIPHVPRTSGTRPRGARRLYSTLAPGTSLMRRASTVVAVIVLTFVAAGALGAPPPEPATDASAATPAARLHALFARAWAESGHGTPPADTADYRLLWGDPSLAREQRRAASARANLTALNQIDKSRLDPADQLSYQLFHYQLEDSIGGTAFGDEAQMLITQLWGPQLAGEELRDAHYDNAAGYQALLRKLNALGPYLDAFTTRLRQAMAADVTQPRVVMARVPDEIKANLASDPAQSPFYAPFKTLPGSIPPADRARLRQQARDTIVSVVNPAYAKFLKFFEADYLPHARTDVGVSSLPDGRAYYAYLVRHYTTTDMTPAEVHALGLKLVAHIHRQMEALFKQIGFRGSYRDFIHFLRTDPKFHYTDPADLLEAYRAATKRVDPHLVDILGTWLLPRVPYGVRPIPAALAPNTYPAYSEPPARDGSRAGYVGVNLYKPESRPKYEIQVLMCHEGRPGHQLQIPVADELDDLPPFRRYAYYNAFGEGWALYAETLCDQPMGLYDDDPYARFGYLNYQMWRAVRLVVDTGIHADGWTRAQAVQYMQDNTALADQNIATEVDRYIVWPGQALSYMLGEQTILKLRAEAQRELGAKYSLRDFNDVVLGQGSLPMAVLQQVVDRWIANTLAGTPVDQLPYACRPRTVAPCPHGGGH
jgi:uncharacterized protein (DUF885 family)